MKKIFLTFILSFIVFTVQTGITYSSDWPTSHPDGSFYENLARWSDQFDFYLWEEDGSGWVEIIPTSGFPFVCSSSFSAIQNGIQNNDIKLETIGGSSFCDDLYVSTIVKLSYWYSTPYEIDFMKPFSLIYDGGTNTYFMNVPALAGATTPDPDPDPLFTQEDMDNMYQDGYDDGKQACIENPLSCGIGNILLFHSSLNPVIQSGAKITVYGTSDTNSLTLKNNAQAALLNFPGNNSIQILSNSDMFTVYRSGSFVTFQGSDGTILKLPATTTVQAIVFNDSAHNLFIDANQVKLDDQVIGTTAEPIQN